jgi:hypothetical protein
MVKAAGLARTARGRVTLTCPVCAKEFSTIRSLVSKAKHPKTCGVVCRSASMSGAANPNYKRGYMESRSGYLMVMAGPKGNRRYRPAHRVVMEETLGRRLLVNEHVHHINGVKHDNRPENLELLGTAAHSRMHREVLGELAKLRKENARLRRLLKDGGRATSS